MRFGILAAGRQFPAWVAQCLEGLEASGLTELALVIEVPAARSARRAPVSALHRWYVEHWLEQRSEALRLVDMSKPLSMAPSVALTAAAGDPARDHALNEVRSARLDFVLRFDALDVPSALLDIARFGVWSYCHERRPAPCFRELMEGLPATRIALERLTSGGVACLHDGYFAVSRTSWVNSIDHARFGSADFCARVCAEIVQGGGDRLLALSAAPEAHEPSPRNRDMLHCLASKVAHSLAKLWELGFHTEVWNVGLSSKSVEQILRDGRIDDVAVTWCEPPASGQFIADPFAYVERGRRRVLVEHYDGVKGRICSVECSDGARSLPLAVELELPHHLSYPCVFEENGEIYCVPEAYQSRRASLYRRTGQGWTLLRHLIEGLPIVDPTLFKHAGRYWLLCSLQNDGAWGNEKLFAYSASSIDGSWQPHPLNPLKCDIGSTRPAGNVFRVDGRLYRPSQDCSSTYGGAIVINEILELSETAFEERRAARLEPIADGPYPHGLHTLNATSHGSVFDSKRFEFDWLAWRKNWGRLHEVLG